MMLTVLYVVAIIVDKMFPPKTVWDVAVAALSLGVSVQRLDAFHPPPEYDDLPCFLRVPSTKGVLQELAGSMVLPL